MFYLYRVLSTLLAPAIKLLVYRRVKIAKEDPARINERFGIAGIERPKGALIWFHAASVGESMSILSLIKSIKTKYPDVNILLTTSTLTSARLMKDKLPKGCIHQFNTLDIPMWVDRFIIHWQPDMVFWVEQEIWPNMIKAVTRRNIDFYLINASLSQKSFEKWWLVKKAAADIFSKFNGIFPKSQTDFKRLQRFGLSNLRTVANLKYSAEPLTYDCDALTELQGSIGARPFWLAASTHEGEELLIEAAHKIVLKTLPKALCILVPRHPDRGEKIASDLKLHNELRTTSRKIQPETAIYIANTMGELGLFYEMADIAFIGGSLVPIGGHNIIEPTMQSCIPIVGSYVSNQLDVVEDFKAANACVTIKDYKELAATIVKHLQGNSDISANGRHLIAKQGNIINEYLEIIEEKFGAARNVANA